MSGALALIVQQASPLGLCGSSAEFQEGELEGTSVFDAYTCSWCSIVVPRSVGQSKSWRQPLFKGWRNSYKEPAKTRPWLQPVLYKYVKSPKGSWRRCIFFPMKLICLMRLSDYKIFLLWWSHIFLWLEVTGRLVDLSWHFSHCKLPGHTFVLLFNYTKVLLCSNDLFLSPSRLIFPERKAHIPCTLLLQAVKSHLLCATPSLYNDLQHFPVVLVGLYERVLQSLCWRFGAEVQRLSCKAWSWQEAQLSQCFLPHLLSPYHDLLYHSNL